MKIEFVLGISLVVLLIICGVMIFTSNIENSTSIENKHIIPLSPTITNGSNEIAGKISHNIIYSQESPMMMGSGMTNKIEIYKTIPPEVNETNTFLIAKKFNVTGNLRGDTTVQSKDLRYYITITKNSGAVEYQDQDRPNEKMDSPDKLPTDDEAIKIATRFLKEHDLYPDGVVDPTPVRENAYTVGKGNDVYYGQIGVWYHRMLNGFRVEDTQLIVYIGGNGEVIGYYSNWRNYQPYQEYPVTSSQSAFGSLVTNGIPVGMNSPDSQVSINDTYLAYKTTAGAYSENYLEPVWVFKGNVLVNGNPVMPIKQYIPALTDESVKSLSS